MIDILNRLIADWPRFYSGLTTTVLLAAASILAAFLWGWIVYFLTSGRSPILRLPMRGYARLSRNTPLLIQLYFIFFGLPALGVRLSPFIAAFIALSAQHGTFFSEIYRSGLEAVSKRSGDAAKALGMVYWHEFRLVLLPQALVRTMPAIGGQSVLLIKDTSLASAIAVAELTGAARFLTSRGTSAVDSFLAVALLYFVLTSLAYGVVAFLEARWRYVEA